MLRKLVSPEVDIKYLPRLPKCLPFCVAVTQLGMQVYQRYYNESRTHTGRNGTIPVSPESKKVIDINNYRWDKHCRGLFELPVAA